MDHLCDRRAVRVGVGAALDTARALPPDRDVIRQLRAEQPLIALEAGVDDADPDAAAVEPGSGPHAGSHVGDAFTDGFGHGAIRHAHRAHALRRGEAPEPSGRHACGHQLAVHRQHVAAASGDGPAHERHGSGPPIPGLDADEHTAAGQRQVAAGSEPRGRRGPPPLRDGGQFGEGGVQAIHLEGRPGRRRTRRGHSRLLPGPLCRPRRSWAGALHQQQDECEDRARNARRGPTDASPPEAPSWWHLPGGRRRHVAGPLARPSMSWLTWYDLARGVQVPCAQGRIPS